MNFDFKQDDIKYVKLQYCDYEGCSYLTRTALRRMGERELCITGKFEEGLNIPTPQQVKIGFACEGGFYSSETELKYFENHPPYIFFVLKTPEKMSYNQKREYFRVKMQEDVLLRCNGKIYPCKTYDISANGIALILDQKIDIPEEVMIDILFDSKEIKTKAKYIRTDSEEGVLKASFYFINLSEANMDIISQKCIKTQLEHKRNSLM